MSLKTQYDLLQTLICARFGSYQVDNDQDQVVLMANKAASQLAFTRNEMEEVTSQGLDPGEWKQIASKTVRHRKNGNALTVQSWARVYVAGTVSTHTR